MASENMDWRIQEDIEALSRRLDALESFCCPANLEAQIHSILKEVLSDGGSLEQTRDCSGLRAKAAVDQLWAVHSADMEKLQEQIADMRARFGEDATHADDTDSAAPLRELNQRLDDAKLELQREAAISFAEFRAELGARLAMLEEHTFTPFGSRSDETEVVHAFPPSPAWHIEETDAARRPLVRQKAKGTAPEWSTSHSGTSLQESTEELKKCLKDLNE
ncbi:unnamed protein product [Durusdinium trenchii]|uniref:Uncharacterized protein n=1 Tax=Durusdinium trenchii TaxID=1381693 RepID=A0ABP0RTR9_9DINO